MLINCGSINYKKSGGAKKVNLVFKAEDYPDNERYYYAIENTRKAGESITALKASTRTKAKNTLYQKLKTYLESTSSQSLGNGDSFNATITDRISTATKKMELVDSELLSYGKDFQGREDYEYWAVYRVSLTNVNF